MVEPSGMASVLEVGSDTVGCYLSQWSATGEQRRHFLLTGVVTLGRAPSADIVVDDLLVSRLHARFERAGQVWTVVDDGLSRNGTFVNGRRLSGRTQLHDRDEVRVGSTVLTFCAPVEDDGALTLVGGALPTPARPTSQQRAVLVALCRPYRDSWHSAAPATNAQIAEELFLTVDAVKTHLRALFHKLGIDDLPQNNKRSRLVELAFEHGLVQRSEL
jgi:DNA-binding CsgD family transcriptional regulator